jgi:uncharacterized ion transporter superfamily protein YfcC
MIIFQALGVFTVACLILWAVYEASKAIADDLNDSTIDAEMYKRLKEFDEKTRKKITHHSISEGFIILCVLLATIIGFIWLIMIGVDTILGWF